MEYTIIKNNFKKFRLGLGLKQTEVAELTNSKQRLISNIEIGFHWFGPYYITNGRIRPWVKPVCELFKCSIKDIWPIQYVEKVKESEISFCGYQVLGITQGAYSVSSFRNRIDDHICIMSVINHKLNEQQKDSLIRHFVLDETLESIGESYNLSRERIRQINNDSLKILKRHLGER